MSTASATPAARARAQEALQQLLDEGVKDRVFPAAQAAVMIDGEVVFSACAGEATPATLFDLGSVTKVACTATSFMSLWAEGRLGPDTPLSRFFRQSPAAEAGVTLADLLFHRSGLPAFTPYFAKVLPVVPELFSPSCPAAVRMEVRTNVVDAASQQPLKRAPRTAAVYSDVGFILLGEVLSDAASDTLDQLHHSVLSRKLGLDLPFRRLSSLSPEDPGPGAGPGAFAPSGQLRPREPAPGQEGLWPPFPAPKPARPGEVDDDNAWVMDGVAGHAGLFGSARELARFGHALLEEHDGKGRIAPRQLWHRAFQVDRSMDGSTRALGFDTPSPKASSAGQFIGRSGPAIGHLGFTGVSLWVDLWRRLSVALCTNRTYGGRADTRIKDFRPRFHDLVFTSYFPHG